MNRTKIKNYAPQARRDFIQAVKDRAAHFGLTDTKTEPVVEVGDGVLIGGKAFTKKVGQQRKRLEERVKQHGFSATMEALAYTWFNRLVAIRFMEVNGYLANGEGGAGYRVLSNPNGKPTPELLDHADHAALPGLNKSKVIDLKIAGNKDAELYRMLLVAQCNALHTAMPFLFERIDDETELVLPESLLHTDSMIRKLVNEIDEEDWKEVEIVGWLYQFYISDKKDEVIGTVVASEDIPAATQLFTPNWIVKYLVQNTLGRAWLATYPHSGLRAKMKYYIEPVEQTPEIQEQLKAITPASLNPDELTLLDPACGSGHILVEAYDLFKAIYHERGYRAKDIPALILQKNLFGLEIDDRAAQLAAFALMMKARADDRRIFESGVKPNVLALQDSQGMNAADLTDALNAPLNKEDVPSEYLFEEVQEEKDGLFSEKALAENGHVSQSDIVSLLALFESAKTLGSLVHVPVKLAEKLPEITQRLSDVLRHGNLIHAPAHILMPLLQQAVLLARQYNFVVANPPYMGSKCLNGELKTFLGKHYVISKADLFSCFIERSLAFCNPHGLTSLVTMQSWMFLATFESLREMLLTRRAIINLTQIGYNSFPALNSKVVTACAFTLAARSMPKYTGRYIDLNSAPHSADKDALFLSRTEDMEYSVAQQHFGQLPGKPLCYSLPEPLIRCFSRGTPLQDLAEPRIGMATCDNNMFLRLWSELSVDSIGFSLKSREEALASKKTWFPHHKGGPFRRWYGNIEYVVNWKNDGELLQTTKHPDEDRIRAHNFNLDYIFKPAIVWTKVTSALPSFRISDYGFLYDDASGLCPVKDPDDIKLVLGLLNSRVVERLQPALNPTLNLIPGDLCRIPFLRGSRSDRINAIVDELIQIAKQDWDLSETSWNFGRHPLVVLPTHNTGIEHSYALFEHACRTRIERAKNLECELNQILFDLYEVGSLISSDVQDEHIALYRSEREEDIKRLVSYAIGCMLGRYSLDKPGLIYASAGNEGFDPSQYKTFPADQDGILPITELDWGFSDDTAKRIEEFVSVSWPKEHLTENLKFVEDGLGTPIRKYLVTGFYKDHLRWYKRRPIYWLFSSGKLRAFQCLVYLHRYHEGTLARMRTEYVNPLQSKIAARLDTLEGDIAQAKGSLRTRLVREQDGLKKQQAELSAFDDKLKNAADQRIKLDLDDGVKVNYGKFGDLLAEVKAVTGGKDDE